MGRTTHISTYGGYIRLPLERRGRSSAEWGEVLISPANKGVDITSEAWVVFPMTESTRFAYSQLGGHSSQLRSSQDTCFHSGAGSFLDGFVQGMD
jgi:hypothetical protein